MLPNNQKRSGGRSHEQDGEARVAGIDTGSLWGVVPTRLDKDPGRVHRRNWPSPQAWHHAVGQSTKDSGGTDAIKGRRIYDDAVREMAIPIWEASGCIRANHLNAALYRIVCVRLRHGRRTRTYMLRRTSEGMSKHKVIRCPERYVDRDGFPTLPRSIGSVNCRV